MKKTRLIFFFPLILISAAISWGQDSAIIDSLMDSEYATVGQAAYLVYSANQALDEDAGIGAAFALLAENYPALAQKGQDEPVTLGQFSRLIMSGFGISGGVFYSLFGGSRYAARELAYRGFVPGNTSPYRKLAGDEVVNILGGVMEWKEES